MYRKVATIVQSIPWVLHPVPPTGISHCHEYICRNQETDVGTWLLTTPQTLFGVHQFSTNVLSVPESNSGHPVAFSCCVSPVPSGLWQFLGIHFYWVLTISWGVLGAFLHLLPYSLLMFHSLSFSCCSCLWCDLGSYSTFCPDSSA